MNKIIEKIKELKSKGYEFVVPKKMPKIIKGKDEKGVNKNDG